MRTLVSHRPISQVVRLTTLLLLLVCSFATHAATVQTLYSASNSLSGIVLAGDGNFYGTTRFGGIFDFGTVFRLTPAGSYQHIYSFTGGNDGANPRAALAVGPDGFLYGTCQYGGTQEAGTVFKINTTASFSLLHMLADATEGGGPIAGLALGSDGLLYGTTSYGGANGYGTLFRISSGGGFSTLHSFTGADGDSPGATLAAGPDNALYGTTQYGGANDRGTAFKITTGGAFSSLFSFNGINGDIPQATMALGPDSALYGMTTYGGTNGLGTIFRITSGGTFTLLYSFDQETVGANPSSGLLLVSGNLQGTANYGGANGFGSIFQVTTAGGFIPLYDFTGDTDGANPYSKLAQGIDGVYGTTEFGGTSDGGTFFKILAATQLYFDTMQRLNGQQVRYAGSGGTPNGQFTILTTTNVATAVANWTATTGQFDASGNFAFTNSTTPPDVRRFYRLRVP